MIKIHNTAEVSSLAVIGDGTSIWNNSQVRERAVIGKNCVIGKDVYIDFDVHIGDNVKIQNHVDIYHGVTIEDGVFIGPHVCFTNDKTPRAIDKNGKIKNAEDWEVSKTLVRYGASIGASAVILPGLVVGEHSMIGSGSVVTKDVPDYGLVYGSPASLQGNVDNEGNRIKS